MQNLIQAATDSRNPVVSQVELNSLWETANTAIHEGQLSTAFGAVEALLCQAYRGNVCSDMLPHPADTKLAQMYSREMLQSLIDRVEGLNYYVNR